MNDIGTEQIEGKNADHTDIQEKEIRIKEWFLVFFIPFLFLLLLWGIEQILETQGILYRSWLKIAISMCFLFLLPFLLFTFLELLLEFWKKRIEKKVISVSLCILQILLIGGMGLYIPVMGFFYLLTFESLFEVEKEIGDGYLEGTTLEFLGANDEKNYCYYTKVSFFGKKQYKDELHIVKMKMEERYGETFQVTEAPDDRMSDTWKGYGFYAIPESIPEITVHVMGTGYSEPFSEDYAVQRSTYRGVHYLAEKAPERPYRIVYNDSVMKGSYGWIHVNCMGQKDMEKCASDTAGVVNAMLSDSFMQNHATRLYIDCYKDKNGGIYEWEGRNIDSNEQMANVPLFITNGTISTSNYQTVITRENCEEQIYQALVAQYQELEKNADIVAPNKDKETDTDKNIDTNTDDSTTMDRNGSTEENQNETGQVSEKEEFIDNSTPEGAYQTLYETLFQPEGDAYQPTYNAKGNFYAILGVGSEEVDGQIQNYRRTVVYDRESKNGKCLLFVAYKEYTYFDGSAGNTAIVNFYAVEKSSGKVVIGNKKAWDEVGTKEYREITGE